VRTRERRLSRSTGGAGSDDVFDAAPLLLLDDPERPADAPEPVDGRESDMINVSVGTRCAVVRVLLEFHR
jgi:hypothetical protein